VTTFVSGRAGGLGWHTRTDDKAPNTASKKLASDDHYCLFEVTPEGLKMKAVNFQGAEIDNCVLPPRKK
jgi:hypothetical protein